METKPKSYKLFVSGVTQQCTEEELKGFFSWFGHIRYVKVLKYHFSRSRSFLVTTNNSGVYSRILQSQNLMFGERILHCKPYIERDANLKAILQDNNNRRVVLKKVPSSIQESEVKILIEELAGGTIERIFSYRSDLAGTNVYKKCRRYKAYSILFACRTAADRLSDMRIVRVGRTGAHGSAVERYRTGRSEEGGATVLRDDRARTGSHFSEQKVASCGRLQDNKHSRVDVNDKVHFLKPTSRVYFTSNTKFQAQPDFRLQVRLLVTER